MDKVIDKFLKRFHDYDNVDDVFTRGCCYWFAVILCDRFYQEGADIVYDIVANHFGTHINGRVYDITGDVTDDYDWVVWDTSYLADKANIKAIYRDCINF